MNEIKNLKTKQINNFMASFDDLKNVSTKQIEEGLKDILGEKPGVDYEYGVDYEINESTGEEIRKHELKKINIIYSYIEETNKSPIISKISYIVG